MALLVVRRKLGDAAIKVQCQSKFGRLESMGPVALTAAGRRRKALEQESMMAKKRRADAFAAKQGYNLLRRGLANLDLLLAIRA